MDEVQELIIHIKTGEIHEYFWNSDGVDDNMECSSLLINDEIPDGTDGPESRR